MVGASVQGLLDVDAELQRSALAAQHQTVDEDTVRVIAPQGQDWDCPGGASQSRHLS